MSRVARRIRTRDVAGRIVRPYLWTGIVMLLEQSLVIYINGLADMQ
jgi:hypothetical protein